MKIINDTGATFATRIVNDDGADLSLNGITNIFIAFDGPATTVRAGINLEMVKTEVNVGIARWSIAHPVSGEFAPVSSITFADGRTVAFADDGNVREISAVPAD